MFADDLCKGHIPGYPPNDKRAVRFRELIRDAVKFTFAKTACDEFKSIYNRFATNPWDWSPCVVLPFEVCWFEFVASDVWEDTTVRRFGGLMMHCIREEVEKEWPGLLRGKELPIIFKPVVEMADTRRIVALGAFVFDSGSEDPFRSVAPLNEDQIACGQALVASILSLNIGNYLDRRMVDMTTSNVKRAKHGQAPMFSHHLCVIKKAATAYAKHQAAIHGGNMRAHLVRGHENHRFTYDEDGKRIGIKKAWHVWPFEKGDRSLGFVTKDYMKV